MNETLNDIPSNAKNFLDAFQNYIGQPLYYYGSIQRLDYVPGKSDIDIDIFTDNDATTEKRVIHFLKLEDKYIKRVFWRIPGYPPVVTGKKIMYKNRDLNLVCEISLYNNRFKDIVLGEHRRKMNPAYHIIISLLIIKLLYYHFHFISGKTYRLWKGSLLDKDDFRVV